MTTYQPPKIWTNDSENGGKFANINRPTAGARHEKTLPVGNNPLQLYSLNTPNGIKINIMLEELAEIGEQNAKYDAYNLDQHLAKNIFMCGDDYTIADMAIWAWYGQLAQGKLYNSAEFLQVESYQHLQRWTKLIGERPAVERAVNLTLQAIA